MLVTIKFCTRRSGETLTRQIELREPELTLKQFLLFYLPSGSSEAKKQFRATSVNNIAVNDKMLNCKMSKLKSEDESVVVTGIDLA